VVRVGALLDAAVLAGCEVHTASAGALSTPLIQGVIVRDPTASVVVEAQLSAASPGRTACLILDLGPASAEAVAAARDLSEAC
jgi:hypothetical protein